MDDRICNDRDALDAAALAAEQRRRRNTADARLDDLARQLGFSGVVPDRLPPIRPGQGDFVQDIDGEDVR